MRTLVINTYAGSLLLGASALGAEIVGSYEDVGYGLGIQQANWPNVNLVPYRAHWPTQDLSETVVIAHPPCSAFSVQNNSESARGTDSNAFSCTKKVLDYAMPNGAVAICIESVMGALPGAWWVHQKYADEHGYYIYRVLQNGSMFSAQWRDRFWVVFIKKGAAPRNITLTLKPTWVSAQEVVLGHEDGPSPKHLDRLLAEQKERLVRDAGCTPEDMKYLFETNHPTRGITSVLQAYKFPDLDRPTVQRRYIGTFASGQLCYVDPDGLAGCVLGISWLYMNGRNLSENAYKRLMGFPSDYIFPDKTSRGNDYRGAIRTYLSKGVIPQVAAWVLGQVWSNLGVKHRTDCPCHGCSGLIAYTQECKPDGIVDFRYRKRHWKESRAGGELPPLLTAYENQDWTEDEEVVNA